MTDIPQWAFDRAKELSKDNSAFYNGPYNAFARYISEHETQPEDPLLQQARDIAADVYSKGGYSISAGDVRSGIADYSIGVQAALAGLRARSEPK